MFSPWYAFARRRRRGDPTDHVSINAVLYGGDTARWAMTERRRNALIRSADALEIGPSRVAFRDGRVEIEIDEWGVPLPRRLCGRIAIELGPVFGTSHALDAAGRHEWRPIAPFARAEVTFDRPALRWSGAAYVDTNAGSEPLERGFRYWTWSRATRQDATTIFYDVERRDGNRHGLALTMRADGRIEHANAPPAQALPGTLWRVRRSVRSEQAPANVRDFEDTPFYTRTGLETVLDGARCPTVCESVDLDRFAAPWVQMLLPFRMPRRR